MRRLATSTMPKIFYYLENLFLFFLLLQDLSNGLLQSTDPDYVAGVEIQMAYTIKKFIKLEMAKFSELMKLADSLEARSKHNLVSQRNDPISMYRSVNLLVDEWKSIEQKIKQSHYETATINRRLPKNDDVTEVLSALFRIQDTYALSTSDLANRLIHGLHNGGTLSAQDCYNIGMHAYNNSDYYHSLTWLQEAEIRLQSELEPTVNESQILPPLIVSLLEQGNRLHALNKTTRLSDLLRSVGDKEFALIKEYPALKDLFAQVQFSQIFGQEKCSILPPITNQRPDWNVTLGQPMYEALCRGEPQQEPDFILSCYYKRTSPYLLLAPIKAELLNKNPDVVLYRAVISDKEIETVQALSRNELERSKIYDGIDSDGVDSVFRTSSTTWLYDEDHLDISNVRRRAGAVTGLNVKTAEAFQVTRYAIGGHYSPHYDHAYDKDDGDRIATLMFYLQEPEAGGATAFPNARIAITPSKNDAIFWYNLKKSGAVDLNTLHAGCPVLSGVKWVANQWIKERGQEFIRLCGLYEEE